MMIKADGSILKYIHVYLPNNGGQKKAGMAPRSGGARKSKLLLDAFQPQSEELTLSDGED